MQITGPQPIGGTEKVMLNGFIRRSPTLPTDPNVNFRGMLVSLHADTSDMPRVPFGSSFVIKSAGAYELHSSSAVVGVLESDLYTAKQPVTTDIGNMLIQCYGYHNRVLCQSSAITNAGGGNAGDFILVATDSYHGAGGHNVTECSDGNCKVRVNGFATLTIDPTQGSNIVVNLSLGNDTSGTGYAVDWIIMPHIDQTTLTDAGGTASFTGNRPRSPFARIGYRTNTALKTTTDDPSIPATFVSTEAFIMCMGATAV